ncbi:hypothetical protein ACO0LL_02270 [Undibacterium sp. TC4M20W]|uniref:hypothetical protein n=1 Tax=Undibacterium sp. TC4M20W TaxID=3413052 RepID=UPI003BF09B1E
MPKSTPSKRRRVAPYDEVGMRPVSVRLTKKQYEMALFLGKGNFSAGIRWAVDWAERHGLHNFVEKDHKNGQKMRKENLSAGIRRILDWVIEAQSQNGDQNILKEESNDNPPSARGRARPRGRPALPDEKIFAAQSMYIDQQLSIKEITETLGIHISTFYRYVNVQRGKQRKPTRS